MKTLNKSMLLAVLLIPATQVFADQQEEMINYLHSPAMRTADVQHQANAEGSLVADQSKVMIADLNTPYLKSDGAKADKTTFESKQKREVNDAQFTMIQSLLTTRL
ncbi:hypothetical protein ACMXYV_05160 [Neptuniibacter sp. SY11_33]|uniref:hypothetical protein n=1 Tax=Neptuniibacter sp. SY11_33 TaxID=3398215 RepID=UPI0039F4B7E5